MKLSWLLVVCFDASPLRLADSGLRAFALTNSYSRKLFSSWLCTAGSFLFKAQLQCHLFKDTFPGPQLRFPVGGREAERARCDSRKRRREGPIGLFPGQRTLDAGCRSFQVGVTDPLEKIVKARGFLPPNVHIHVCLPHNIA